jgi:hypothetical protein
MMLTFAWTQTIKIIENNQWQSFIEAYIVQNKI